MLENETFKEKLDRVQNEVKSYMRFKKTMEKLRNISNDVHTKQTMEIMEEISKPQSYVVVSSGMLKELKRLNYIESNKKVFIDFKRVKRK